MYIFGIVVLLFLGMIGGIVFTDGDAEYTTIDMLTNKIWDAAEQHYSKRDIEF